MSFQPLRGRRPLTALCAAALVLAVPSGPASPADGPPPATAPASALSSASALSAAPAAARTVTLVTGDRVTATATADGGTQVSVHGPDGLLTGHETRRDGDDTYVYPHRALPYVAAGLVDHELFNVTRLLADGYSDTDRDRLPLIVTYTDAAARARSLPVPEGTRKVRALDSIQGAALTAERSPDFWSAATGTDPDGRAQDPDAPARLRGGIAKVWLDGRVRATLADTTAQIGAPGVWDSGNTGEGVDVAVLDTGVDTEHPDLTGRIAARRSFVPEEEVTDRNGHGTHVASIVAGSGAASDGRERGVAPDARLHIGKVLSDQGYGQDSWIVAGMEWAAREQGAKVINLSLGGEPTDGTDPLSLAVDELSAETGALFTVAAGNSGPLPYSVGAPGAADAALTVGAVDGGDRLADFSGRGPRLGDGAVKPDLTAPGVGVLAARSQHAPEGEGPYQALSGTSMAAPHASGAAALLAAEHPDWTGAQLKSALVSQAKPTPDHGPFEAGAGRLDIAAASTATLFATGSVDFGYPSWPTAPGATTDRRITYTNRADTPVALDLAVDLPDGPTDLFTLSADRVTVPAHGTATVTLTTHLDHAPQDRMTAGAVTATDDSGTIRARTVAGAGREGERHRLTLKANDRGGRPIGGTVILTARHFWQPVRIDDSGTLDLRLPPGRYTAWLDAEVEGANGPHSLGLALLTLTDIDLTEDRTATFDATRARRISAVTPKPSTPDGSRFDVHRGFAADDWSASSRWPMETYDSVWTLPTGEKVTEGEFGFGTRWRLSQPALTIGSAGRAYDDLRAHVGARPLPRGNHRLDAVFAGDGGADAYTRLRARGKAAVVRRDGAVSVEQQAAAASAAGAALLLVVHDGTGRLEPWNDSPWSLAAPAPLPVATLTRDEGEALIGRLTSENRVRLDVTSRPVTEYVYDLTRDYRDTVPADLTHRPAPHELARVDVSFRNFRPGRAMHYRGDVSLTGPAGMNPSSAPAIGERTDWVTAGEEWTDTAMIAREQGQTGSPVTYRPGTVHTAGFFGPVQRPRLADGIGARRYGDEMAVLVPGWGDSGTDHVGDTYGNFHVSNVLKLYQGDTLVQEANRYQLWMAVSGLRRERLPYRLVSENTRDAEWPAPYSTATRTEWGFTSGTGGTAEAADQLPLIQLDYDVTLDPDSRASRHADLTLTPSHLSRSVDTAAIRTAGLEFSYDDGATWHRATLKRAGDSWRTRLDAPRSARFVTLRATARDAGGNSVEQRIDRAFGVR
ncbi:S8 family serine peptidase [Streptomyces sp. B93]|uniref:S8 family serine peptidase n=1 Tax=Streptomyces sp. B93 TaxID=2824875 RepID=UPI0027E57400|nr:S8 family serine peptidase [Streptomyces sp. B93]